MANLEIVSSTIYDYIRSIIESGFGFMFIFLMVINTISLALLLWQYKKRHNIGNKLVQRFLNSYNVNYFALQLFEAIKIQLYYFNKLNTGQKVEDKVIKPFKDIIGAITKYISIFYFKMLELFSSKIFFKFKITF